MSDLQIPFRLRGHNGVVRVHYVVNTDPQQWGNPLLGEPTPPLARADIGRGFPACTATVSFEGRGYAAYMGWIQIVRFSGARSGVLVDVMPQLIGLGVPYVCWGPCPTLFDNPHTDDRGVEWKADTFLVATPDAVMTRVVQSICSFSWGWSTTGDTTGIEPPTVAHGAAWLDACVILRPQYPDWKFLEEPPAELTSPF
ncbi:MAG TPA: hypothetical protein VEC99_03250 [Clostridia bacterium]|nr:hypothetical protein [Clostridia bacterium]